MKENTIQHTLHQHDTQNGREIQGENTRRAPQGASPLLPVQTTPQKRERRDGAFHGTGTTRKPRDDSCDDTAGLNGPTHIRKLRHGGTAILTIMKMEDKYV